MNILITGIHGFVGSNLVRGLSKEHTIYGLDIEQSDMKGVVTIFPWAMLDTENAMPEIDAVIHLAGQVHDIRDTSASDVFFKVNTDLTKKVFDWYEAQPKTMKFIFFSTVKAAAECVPEVLYEDVTPMPQGPYGESKLRAEEYILAALEQLGVSRASMTSRAPGDERPANGKEVYIFRPCMIHGPGNKGNLNLLYNVVRKGIPWPLGAYENRRTFTSVENVCFAVNGVLTGDVPSGIYNMGDDDAISTNGLIQVICDTLGMKSHIWHIPRNLVNCVAKVGGWLHLPLNPLSMRKLTENYVSSNAKIKQALGVEKFPVDAHTGLVETIKCFTNGNRLSL